MHTLLWTEVEIQGDMKWYTCSDCGAVRSADNLEYKHYASDYCNGVAVHRGKPKCSECGSTDLTASNACEMCNEPTEDLKHELCPRCSAIAKDIADYAKQRFDLGNYELVNLLDSYESDTR